MVKVFNNSNNIKIIKMELLQLIHKEIDSTKIMYNGNNNLDINKSKYKIHMKIQYNYKINHRFYLIIIKSNKFILINNF